MIHSLEGCAFSTLQTLTLAQLCETAFTDKCTVSGGRGREEQVNKVVSLKSFETL